MDTQAKALNRRHGNIPADAIYVGRPTKWGNPFVIGRDGDRDEVIAKYEAWLTSQPSLMAALSELRGHDLVCWCSPDACHADVLIRLANQPDDEPDPEVVTTIYDEFESADEYEAWLDALDEGGTCAYQPDPYGGPKITNMITVRRDCPYCGKRAEATVPVDGYNAWMRGTLIQDALPDTSPDDREILVSGMHPECWDLMFDDVDVDDDLFPFGGPS